MNRYEIYQLDFSLDENVIRDYGFRSYEEVKEHGLEIKKERYVPVYTLETEEKLSLDDLYYIFNMMRPEDFKAHSLSVSDVIRNDEGYWYCDSFGWVKLDWSTGDTE